MTMSLCYFVFLITCSQFLSGFVPFADGFSFPSIPVLPNYGLGVMVYNPLFLPT